MRKPWLKLTVIYRLVLLAHGQDILSDPCKTNVGPGSARIVLYLYLLMYTISNYTQRLAVLRAGGLTTSDYSKEISNKIRSMIKKTLRSWEKYSKF